MSHVEKLSGDCWQITQLNVYAILGLDQMEALEQYFKENPDWNED